MKTILLALAGMITLSLSAQTKAKLIQNIEKTKNEILNIKETLKKKEISNSGDVSKTAYFNAGNLLLLSVKQSEANLEKNVDWYFTEGVLVYSETNWKDPISSKIIKNEKQYLSNGHLLAWLNSENKFVEENSPEFISLDKELSNYGLKIKQDIER